MGDDKEWQRQLLSAALTAGMRTLLEYIRNPDSRDETVSDMKAKLAEVDYTQAAKAVSDVIDRLADSSKLAVSSAIDNIRANAEDAVEAAAEKAQEQLGSNKKSGRGRLLFGILLGIALGFVLLNEDRRNQIMDKLTGASGPIDSSQWETVPNAASVENPTTSVPPTVSETTTGVTETTYDTAETSPPATEEPAAGTTGETGSASVSTDTESTESTPTTPTGQA
jgi:hypothetical protein